MFSHWRSVVGVPILLIIGMLVLSACGLPQAQVPTMTPEATESIVAPTPDVVATGRSEAIMDADALRNVEASAVAAATARAATASVTPVVPSIPPASPTVPTVPTVGGTVTATVYPTPSPRPAGTPWRVGLQVGHWRSEDLPEELARLRTSSGAYYNGVTEAELNYEIATRVQALLEAEGVVVDLLPATVPPGYDADAFIAIHADGSPGSAARGWKLATYWRTSQASQQLLDAVAAAYGPATGLPEDVGGVTVNMRGYYAFSYRRHEHAVARTTPALIVEMGFMTNAADRAVLFGRPDRVAAGIATGIMDYLRQRDPSDGAALLPPEYSPMTGLPGAVIRAAPSDNARVLLEIGPDALVIIFTERDGWYEVVVRGEWRTVGWVRADQLVVSDQPASFPTSTNP
jgi:hypothetical protein